MKSVNARKLTYRKSLAALRKIGGFDAEFRNESNRLALGGVVLLFDKAEFEVLRLCAWCKDLPASGCRNIPADTLDTLVSLKLIRLSRNGLGYRCTPEGFTLLQGAEMSYQQDKTYRSNSDALTRRFQTAQITSFFWRYGANVFTQSPPAEMESNIFLPSFALRRQQHANILGGAKLTGFYYTKDSVFIPYFITEDNNGIFPDVEQRIFRADIFLQDRRPHILYTGDGNLEKIINTVSFCKERSAKATTVYYKDAMDRFACPVALVPLTTDGMRQLRILSVPDYRQRLVKNILGDSYLPPESPQSDGRNQSEDFIIGIDCNILRFEKAIKSNKPTNIFVLPFQAETIRQITDGTNAKCFYLNLEQTENYLGLSHDLPTIEHTPFQTGKGNYVNVPPLGKDKKTGK